MTDYKDLFYRSQAKIADFIEELDSLSLSLKNFMADCENELVSDNDDDVKKIKMLKND